MSLRDRLSRTIGSLLGRRPGAQHASGLPADPNSATMMEKLDAALNNMSHGPDIAEGVETEQQRAFLAKTGSDRTSGADRALPAPGNGHGRDARNCRHRRLSAVKEREFAI
jgi:predicted signal transduction protein with EAL and GGDEF domain